MADAVGGWNSLALNPTDSELLAACSSNFTKKPAEGETDNIASVQLYKLNEDSLSNMEHSISKSNKRQKTEISTFAPSQSIQINGGISTLTWLDDITLVAGCHEHAIKLVDIEKSYIVKQSILTQHKVPTCIDTSGTNLLLSGSEDSIIRLWDIRTGSDKPVKQLASQYEGHSKYISQV